MAFKIISLFKYILIIKALNTIFISCFSLSLNNAKIFNYYTESWVSIENAEIEYKNDEDGKITYLDLFNSDQGIYYSEQGVYPHNFDISKYKVEFFSHHDINYNCGEFYPKIYNKDGIQYIGIYNIDNLESDKYIKKSSFDYILKLSIEGTQEEKNVTFRYNKNYLNISTYTTCFHSLDIEKTLSNFQNYKVESYYIEKEYKISRIELKTTDNYLYNYDIGIEKFALNLSPENDKIMIRIEPFTINGIYDIYIKSDIKISFASLSIEIDNIKKEKSISFIDIIPYYLEFKEPQLFQLLRVDYMEEYYMYIGNFKDGNLYFNFKLLDFKNNTVTKSSSFDSYVNIWSSQLGDLGDNFSGIITINFNSDTLCFTFQELQKGTNQYIFFFKENNRKYYIYYETNNTLYSSISIENSFFYIPKNYTNINGYIYIYIYLKNEKGEFKLSFNEKDIPKAIIEGYDSSNNKIELNWEYIIITNEEALKFKCSHNKIGEYKIISYYSNQAIINNSSDTIVIAPIFSFGDTIFQIIINSTIDLYSETINIIYIKREIPYFKLYLYLKGVKITSFSDYVFSCFLTRNDVNISLDLNIKDDYVGFYFNANNKDIFSNLLSGYYNLTFFVDIYEQNFILYLEDEKGTDNLSEINDFNSEEKISELISEEKISDIISKEIISDFISEEKVSDIISEERIFDIISEERITNIISEEKISIIITEEKLSEITSEERITDIIFEENTSNIITEEKISELEKIEKDNIEHEGKNKSNCDIIKFLKNECKFDINEKDIVIIEIKSKLSNDINYLLRDINFIDNEEIEIVLDDITFSFEQLDSKGIISNNFSTIYFGNCERILRKQYKLSNDSKLFIFKFYIKFRELYIPINEYEIYDPINNINLNLDYCNTTKISIKTVVNINEKDLFKYDPNSDFYNDFCFKYTTESGTDIILSDRKKEYEVKNLSLCEKNCEFEGYDFKTKKVSCNCEVKVKMRLYSEIYIDTKKLMSNFKNINKISNLYVIYCYKLLFEKDGLKYNIGNYIILFIILIHIIGLILFIYKGNKNLSKKINKLINIYKEIKDINKPENNNHKIIKIKNRKNKNDHKNKNKQNLKINNKKIESSSRVKIKNISIKKNDKSSSRIKIKKISDKKIKIKNSVINIINRKETTYNNNICFKYNDNELNTMTYKEALINDKRSYIQYYISLLKTKHALIFSFYTKDDYNSKIIKICVFFFSFSLYYTMNTFFFVDSTIHKIYEDNGTFNFIYQLPKILYSTIISFIINAIVSALSLSENNILEIKYEKKQNIDKKAKKIKKKLKIKFILYFSLSFLLLVLFWFYLSCFCVVYPNSQIHLIKDALISFGLSLIYPLLIKLVPGLFRIPSLKSKKKNRKCLFNFSKIIQLI